MSPSSHEAIRHRMAMIQEEHRDLDAALASLVENRGDEFTIRRLKKRKLRLKDELTRLQMMLVPDIHA